MIDILDIDEITETFTVQTSFKREWFDGRLMYKHLKRGNTNKNRLLEEESISVWYPRTMYKDVKDLSKISKTNFFNKQHVVITNKDFKFLAKNNMHIFKGSDNGQSLDRQYTTEYICQYKMHWYPFDTQLCRIKFLLRETDFIKLQPTHLEYNPDIALERYFIKGIKMCRSIIEGRDAIVTEVTLGRPLIAIILSTFIPTLSLLAISFIARFYVDDYRVSQKKGD